MQAPTPTTFRLNRFAGNPILAPLSGSEWEGEVTTNPGAFRDEATGDVYLLYRAAGHEEAHRVFFGLARSRDGYHFERVSDQPVLSPLALTPDGGCVEDPRVIKIGDWFYVTAATRALPPGRYWTFQDNQAKAGSEFPDEFPAALRRNFTSTQLYLTQDFKTWIRAGRLTDPSVDDRDVVIFPEQVGGKWVTLHRPMQWHGKGFDNPYPAIWIACCDDLLEWKELRLLMKGEKAWERKVGANNPPLKTEAGWLQIYHGVGEDKQYRLGAVLLDLDDPSRVTHRTPEPIYEPEADYEKKGIYDGVCFPCGHVVIDGTYFLYYGAADVSCAVATAPLDEFLAHLLANPVA
ncbi:MAG: glycosidase [Verrucomicrobiota bacterium JB022]|nr:glycosidase [Verrucomicrobiota bacterium JB022]